jgi:hypothetical protein
LPNGTALAFFPLTVLTQPMATMANPTTPRRNFAFI